MGAHYLHRFFYPKSIAVYGASDRTDSVGMRVFANLISSGYSGDLYPINPKHKTVQNVKCYPDLRSVKKKVDLAIVATPARTVLDIIRDCGDHGIKSMIIMSSGFGEIGERGRTLEKRILDLARATNIRLIGPNCLGLIRPEVKLNATFSKNNALPGDVALVSQSGALCTAILDWAIPRKIGFSAVVSLGDAADTGFGDLLTYLATDPGTRSILLYVEGIRHARSFLSGLRAAARMKPVIVVKSGRHDEGSRAAMSHTGALIGGDDVFNAALERAGVVRAYTIEQLFAAAEVLSGSFRVSGERLCIITNGGGPGVLATDRAVELGVKIANLSDDTMHALNKVLPDHWSHNNPVDILGDSPPERYEKAVSICLKDSGVDGALVLLTPQAMTDPLSAAKSVIHAARDHQSKPILTAWMGEDQVHEARDHFAAEKMAVFTSPEAAVEAFSYLAEYRRNQQLLTQVPDSGSLEKTPDIEGARMIIEGALSEGRKYLDITEARAVLSAFHLPVRMAVLAHTANEALVAAETLGYPVALKINATNLTHKTDVGGVRLNISSPHEVRIRFNEILEDVQRVSPGTDIRGVTVEPMIIGSHRRELLVGVVNDPVFGPVITFGSGGTAVEVIRDRAMALPPLNRFLIERMISRTKVARMLGHFRNMPPIPAEDLHALLLRLSQMVCELPEIRELDLNPVIADESGVVVVDARISVNFPSPGQRRYSHMAIHPYPNDLVTMVQLHDGTTIRIRPIRPEDADREQAFVRGLSEQSRYFRFLQTMQELSPEMLVRFTQIDYYREMALVAVLEGRTGEEKQIGVARYVIDLDGRSCEFAIVVADEWHGKGIGSRLMKNLMNAARAQGLSSIRGEVHKDNSQMLRLMKNLGFLVRSHEEDKSLYIVEREL